MKVFIDTSNKKLILALLDYSDNIKDYKEISTNNNMVKITVDEINKFYQHNKIESRNVTEYFLVTGPGSFTGVKVGLNFINTMSLVSKVKKVHTINSFRLIEDPRFEATVIPFGKNKYYHKAFRSKKIRVITHEELRNLPNVNDGYDNLTKEKLQWKIKQRIFKTYENLDKIKVEYLSAF